jgi:hypothetical protein
MRLFKLAKKQQTLPESNTTPALFKPHNNTHFGTVITGPTTYPVIQAAALLAPNVVAKRRPLEPMGK